MGKYQEIQAYSYFSVFMCCIFIFCIFGGNESKDLEKGRLETAKGRLQTAKRRLSTTRHGKANLHKSEENREMIERYSQNKIHPSKFYILVHYVLCQILHIGTLNHGDSERVRTK